MDVTHIKPVHKCAKKAKISPKLHAHNKQAAATAAQQLNVDITVTLEDIDDIIDKLALKHAKPVEVIQELLHLGGHVLKSHRTIEINNAYAYCEARCDTDCMCAILNLLLQHTHHVYF